MPYGRILVAWGLVASSLCAISQTKQAARIDPEKAQKACEQNNLSACLRLGVYEQRRGQTAAAEKWLTKACLGGDHRSCLHLGDQAKDQKTALRWFKTGCRSQSSQGLGCARAADIATKLGSTNNAKHWNQKACARGQKDRC